MGRFVIAVCFASLALGEDADRVFKLMNATTVLSQQEIATTLRSVARIQQLSLARAVPSLTVNGTADQIALAEWLIPRLDVAGGSNHEPQEYWVAGNSDDVLVVYGLANTTTLPGIQEICTALRTVGQIEKIYTVTPPKVITLRGTASEIALASFLLAELDHKAQPRQSATVREFKPVTGTEATTVVYGLAHTEEPASIQEIATTLRAVLEIQKIMPVFAPRLIAIHCSPAQVQMAEWLVPLLDREKPTSSGNEAHMPGGNDDVVHVFYLPPATSSDRINGLLKEMHNTVHIFKVFVRTEPPALVLRGKADQIAMAARIIDLADPRRSQ